MLNKCADGHTWVEKDHRIHVTYRGKAYRHLPTGKKGGKGEVKRLYVKQLASQLEIEDCAKREIPAL
jgi:hypothetical protein